MNQRVFYCWLPRTSDRLFTNSASCLIVSKSQSKPPSFRSYLSLTPGLRSYCVQLVADCILIHKILLQYFRLQQRDVAFLEVDDNCAGDVLTLVCAHRHHRRQTPLQFTNKTSSQITLSVHCCPPKPILNTGWIKPLESDTKY